MPATKEDRPAILVTDAGRGSAISVIRSLGRKGWRVIAADSDPSSLGFRSRYAAERLVYPPPETAPAEFVQGLLQAVRERRVGLVIPVTDSAILPLSEQRDQFSGLCQLAIPDAGALQVVTDKMQTLDLARRVGVPAPRTCLVHTAAEAEQAGQHLGSPIVLKPVRSRLYREKAGIEAYTVTYAQDQASLVRQMQRFEGHCPVLLQEYYAGIGQGVELLMRNGQALAAFQHRRLREIPIYGGASAFRESVRLDPLLYQYSMALLSALNWTGLAMVEFKVGQEGPKLMEINGRIWGSIPLAVMSGVDFPALLADLYLTEGQPGSDRVHTDYKVGLRARNLDLEILWILAVLSGKRRYPFMAIPGRRQALRGIFQLFHPAYKFDIQSWEDPAPGLAEIPKIIRKLRNKFAAAN